MEEVIRAALEEYLNKALLAKDYKIYKTKLPRKLKKKYKKEGRLAITIKYIDSIPNIKYTVIVGEN